MINDDVNSKYLYIYLIKHLKNVGATLKSSRKEELIHSMVNNKQNYDSTSFKH